MATQTRTRPGAGSPLSPIERSRTTAEEVEDRLIMAIARGDIASGERITEAEIAAAMNVSRVPAREAMQKLQLRGILVGGAQRGLRVADYSEQRIAELFELRLAIETIIFQHVMASSSTGWRSRPSAMTCWKMMVSIARRSSNSSAMRCSL